MNKYRTVIIPTHLGENEKVQKIGQNSCDFNSAQASYVPLSQLGIRRVSMSVIAFITVVNKRFRGPYNACIAVDASMDLLKVERKFG